MVKIEEDTQPKIGAMETSHYEDWCTICGQPLEQDAQYAQIVGQRSKNKMGTHVVLRKINIMSKIEDDSEYNWEMRKLSSKSYRVK
jgi:hypothetical protein